MRLVIHLHPTRRAPAWALGRRARESLIGDIIITLLLLLLILLLLIIVIMIMMMMIILIIIMIINIIGLGRREGEGCPLTLPRRRGGCGPLRSRFRCCCARHVCIGGRSRPVCHYILLSSLSLLSLSLSVVVVVVVVVSLVSLV